jgi:hypothetical protein
MDDMTATVARCHFWWNNFFFSSLPLSLRFSSITTLLLLTTTYTHTCISNSERTKKMRFSFFFFFFFYSVLLLCVWRRVCRYESLMQLFFGERQNDKEERKALVSTLVPWQATIYRFAIYYRPLLSSLLCLSLSPSLSFFLSTAFICARTLVRLYLSLRHASRTQVYMYKWSGWWWQWCHYIQEKSLYTAMTCIYKEERKEIVHVLRGRNLRISNFEEL